MHGFRQVATDDYSITRLDFVWRGEFVHPSSTPPTRTEILRGKGDTSEFVMGGTAPRPFSEEVCVSIARRLFVNVVARFLLNCCRSDRPERSDLRSTPFSVRGVRSGPYLVQTLVDVFRH